MRRWLRSNVEFVATKKGMSAALALAAHKPSELTAYSFDRLTGAVGTLLDRAVAAGEIRADVGPEDLLRTLLGLCYMHDRPDWQSGVLRLVDGLRAGSGGGAAQAGTAHDAAAPAPDSAGRTLPHRAGRRSDSS